jgi:hypothetical protein
MRPRNEAPQKARVGRASPLRNSPATGLAVGSVALAALLRCSRKTSEAEHGGEDRSHVVTGHDQRRGARRAALAGELLDEGDRRRQAATQAEAGEEPERGEHGDRGGERAQERADGEDRHRCDHDPAAADVVRDRADPHCADGHADQADGRDERAAGRGEPPHVTFEQYRNHGAEHDQVETVEQDSGPTQREHERWCPSGAERVEPGTDIGGSLGVSMGSWRLRPLGSAVTGREGPSTLPRSHRPDNL